MRRCQSTRREFCRALLFLSPAAQVVEATMKRAWAAPDEAPAAGSSALSAVPRPCSLRKISVGLSRIYGGNVATDPSLADLRVVWSFQREPSLDTILARLAELTGSRVVERSSVTGKRRLVLERKPGVARQEAAWKQAALSRTIRELLRAADEDEHGQLRPETFSKNVQTYLSLGRAPQLKYVRLLTPEQMGRLLQGELIRFAPSQIPEAEIEQIVRERYSGPGHEDESQERIQQYQEHELQQVRQYGMALQIDFNRKGPLFYLMLKVGLGGNVLCGFGAEELGLSLTRTNPYRLLEAVTTSTPTAPVPTNLRRPLDADVVLPPGDTRWETALQELARTAGLEVVSDAYLCRMSSRQFIQPGGRLTVARRGVMLGEALDLMCRQYGYLWWEKDGCCYFRSRTWPWEADYEVPDRFLDPWDAALARGTVGPREIAALASLTPLQMNGLGDLGGHLFQSRANLGSSEVRPFFQLFRSCTPAQQAQLMGQGLLVRPEQVPGYGPDGLPIAADEVPHPLLLRLTQSISMDSSVSPPAVKATFRVTLPLEAQVRRPEFSVEIPRGAGELNPPESRGAP